MEKKLKVTLETFNDDPAILQQLIETTTIKYKNLGWAFSHHSWERTDIRTIVEIEFEKLK